MPLNHLTCVRCSLSLATGWWSGPDVALTHISLLATLPPSFNELTKLVGFFSFIFLLRYNFHTRIHTFHSVWLSKFWQMYPHSQDAEDNRSPQAPTPPHPISAGNHGICPQSCAFAEYRVDGIEWWVAFGVWFLAPRMTHLRCLYQFILPRISLFNHICAYGLAFISPAHSSVSARCG